jgi:hypothetical protein
MIRSVKHLKRFDVVATDGSIGSVDDFYFDDQRWAIRYLIVDTGKWLPGRRVLVSPYSVIRTEWGDQRLLLSITRDQVKDSPGVDTNKPVSRQHEADYLRYYGYPLYWAHTGLWGAYPTPLLPSAEQMARTSTPLSSELRAEQSGDSHLRSISEVNGYVIRATDGDLGHIDDFLITDVSWALRYFVINTSNWWFGQKVLAAPSWITAIDWATKTVDVNVTREAIRTAPLYDRAEHIDQQWEAAYHQHIRGGDDWLEAEDAAAIKAAHEYLQEQPDRAPDGLERRARPRS